MKPNWRKRLDKVAVSMKPRTNGVTFFLLDGESKEEMEQRVARWKAGETVEGMDCAYTGRERLIWLLIPVEAPKRDE